MKYSPGILIPLATIIITLLLTWIFAPWIITFVVHPDEDESHYFPSYKECVPTICGNSTIRYPFGKCGVLSTQCMDNHTIIFPDIHGRVVGDITELSYSTRTLQIVQHIGRPDEPVSYSYSEVFDLSKGYIMGSIYNCTQQPTDISKNMTWLDWGETDSHYLFSSVDAQSDNISGCAFYFDIVVPADTTYNISADKNFEQLQQRGFQSS